MYLILLWNKESCNYNLQTISYLINNWISSIEQNLKMYLRHAGKGWYDITVESPFIYDVSKSSHIMQLIKQYMQNTLRVLVFNSANTLVNLVEIPCQCTLKCQPNFRWGDDLRSITFKPATQPIFSMQLVLGDQQAYFSTEPEKFLVLYPII